MGRIEDIEQQVKALSPEELAQSRTWFLEYDWAALGPTARTRRTRRQARRARRAGSARPRIGADNASLIHHASRDFWACYRSLPQEIQKPSDRIPKLLASAALGLATALGPTAPVGAQSAITVTNALPTSTVCPNGNTVSAFAPQQQVIQPGGHSIRVTGDFSSFPGLGIQVNNWYWTSITLARPERQPAEPRQLGRPVLDLRPVRAGPAARLVRQGHPDLSHSHRHRSEDDRRVHDHGRPQRLHQRRHAGLLLAAGHRRQHLRRPLGSHQQRPTMAAAVDPPQARPMGGS